LAIETIDGVGQLIELDRAIADPPDAAPIAKISALDLDDLARSLREKRSLIEINCALSGKPDLSSEDPHRLALATSMAASEAPFAERDRIKINGDRSVVTARLLRKVPARGSDTGPRGGWTGMALLRNEFPKQRRFTPIRGLLSRAGDSILTLKPCFMMSPLSLAKFAKPGLLEFDIVVVDEASQMKPEEALGALLRAKQIVVVGDANQLPPRISSIVLPIA